MIVKNHLDIMEESRPNRKLKELKALVIHWTGVPNQTKETVRNWWNSDNGVYGSAHYIVDTKGDILETIPPTEVGYHVGSAQSGYTEYAKVFFGANQYNYPICSDYDSPNNYTIGIEIIPCDSTGNFTDKSYQAAVELAASILKVNGLTIDQMLMHSHIRTVNEKRCPKLFVDDPAKWELFKHKVKLSM